MRWRALWAAYSCLRHHATSTPVAQAENTQIATFAAGCFWGVEHIFVKHYPPADDKGILKTSVGYTGGKVEKTNPDYRTVCSGVTDHAEAVRIEFNPDKVSYDELVGEFCYQFWGDNGRVTGIHRVFLSHA